MLWCGNLGKILVDLNINVYFSFRNQETHWTVPAMHLPNTRKKYSAGSQVCIFVFVSHRLESSETQGLEWIRTCTLRTWYSFFPPVFQGSKRDVRALNITLQLGMLLPQWGASYNVFPFIHKLLLRPPQWTLLKMLVPWKYMIWMATPLLPCGNSPDINELVGILINPEPQEISGQ